MDDELEGLIVDVNRNSATDEVSEFDMVMFDVAPCTATLPMEDIFTVTVPTAPLPEFRIDEDDFIVDPTLFDDRKDLEIGQKVDVDIMDDFSTLDADPDVTAEKIKLEDQTIRGTVLSISGTTFELVPNSALFPDLSITVETSALTRFDDLPSGVGSLVDGQAVRVKGLLFRLGSDQQKMLAKRVRPVDSTP